MSNESVDLLIQRAEVLRPRNITQSFSLLRDALGIAQKSGYRKGIAQVHFDSVFVMHLKTISARR